jgi:hypothetical protein
MTRAYIKGRIVQHLEQDEEVARIPQRQLTDRVEELSEQIEQIEARLDPENERDQVASRLNVIAEDMSGVGRGPRT